VGQQCKRVVVLIPDTSSDNLFAHFSEIHLNGFISLPEGQKVTYDDVRRI
jgi:cold shock CspA family protein